MFSVFTHSFVQVRHLAALLTLASVVATSGCAGGGSEEGPFISPLLDTDRATSAVVGPSGGRVQATGADGTQYTLTIPADALPEATEISLTPIRAIDDLPMSGGLIDGVHFEPSGLQLLRAATLTVELAFPPALGEAEMFVGFTYDGDGENLALAIPEVDGNTFHLPIRHFSGGGAGAATPSDLEVAFAPGTTDAFIAELSAAIPIDDEAAFKSILGRWYQAVVKPELQAAVTSDAALQRALDTRGRWLDVQLMSGVRVSDLLSESNALAAAAFGDAVARANDLCVRQRSFAEAETAMFWQRRAEAVLPDDMLLPNGLDRDSVGIELCVQVVYESTSFPAAPIAGEPETLRVVVGYAFGDGPIEVASGMVVNVLAFDANPADTATATDGAGQVALALTPQGGNLQIEIDACIGSVAGAGPLTGEFICQEAFILRGLVVTPTRATLAPGGRQRFTADLLGIDEPVTWTATGGTIDASGLFVAGSTSGTFTITASSIANPSLTATAQVTIEVVLSDFPTFAVWQGPVTLHGENGATFVQNGEIQTNYNPSTGALTARTCQGPNDQCLGLGCDALWEGTVSGNQLSITMVNHTSPCAIGDLGQNRRYDCTLNATFSQDPDGTQRLVANGDGTFFSCNGLNPVTLEVCIGGCP